MSPAEFKTLREACGLSQQAAAAFLAVHLNTVQQWESGRSRVAAGAGEDMQRLDAQMERAVLEMIDTWREKAAEFGEPAMISLARWRGAEAYAGTHHAAGGLPYGAHCALIGRAATALRRLGAPVEISYVP